MLDLDEKALTDQLATGFDIGDPQMLLENQLSAKLDMTKVFYRWSIQAGDSRLVASDGLTEQLGVAIFQIVAPAQTWADDASAVRDQLFDAFRRFRSDDRCLRVYKLSSDKPPSKGSYIINCKVFWESYRRP